MNIGIIGQGFVGNAVYQKFKNFYNVYTFDLKSDLCNSTYKEIIKKNIDNIVLPKKGDLVQISYEISDLKDEIIYSKQFNGIKNYKVDEEDFIPGIQQGLKLMKIGETVKFIIPSFNAYDVVGDENKIGVNTSIISTVTLINIK